jgi:hypothetical protein
MGAIKPWDLDPGTGFNLTRFSVFVYCFLKFGSHIRFQSGHQSRWYAERIGPWYPGNARGICDTRPTLVSSTIFLRSRCLSPQSSFPFLSFLDKLLETKPKRTRVVEKMQGKQETLHHFCDRTFRCSLDPEWQEKVLCKNHCCNFCFFHKSPRFFQITWTTRG